MTLGDLEEAAERRTPASAWAYVQGGAGAERTLRENRAAFERRTLRPRLLSDVATIDLGARLLGHPVSAPFFVAPTAYQAVLHPDAEAATARAAARAGLLAMFSTLSSLPLETVGAVTPRGPRWFQLYLQPEEAASLDLVARAERAGFTAIVLTADVPVLGTRDRQTRGGFAIETAAPIGNGPGVVTPPRFAEERQGRFELGPPADTTWAIVGRIRRASRLPVIVKGVLTAEDARSAVSAGARAVVVSNHGGRQLDGAPAALDALPEVVGAVGSRAEVYLDGGVRRGSDILMALALGARAVGLGRPVLWALAAGGEAGVARLFRLLKLELANVMAQVGRRSLDDLTEELVRPPGTRPPVRRAGRRRASGPRQSVR